MFMAPNISNHAWIRQIRFLLTGLLAFFIGLSGVSASSGLPTPEEVLTRARTSRSEFSDLVFELRASLPDLATKQRIGPYLRILGEMRVIQLELNFGAMDVDMILELAEKMTLYIAPQMDLTSDPEWLLEEFVRWSQDSSLSDFCGDQERLIASVTGIDRIFEMLTRVGKLIDVVNHPGQVLKRTVHSADEFAKIQGRLNQKLIDSHIDEVTPAEYARFLTHVYKAGAIQGGFDSLSHVAYVRPDRDLLSKIIQLLVLTRKRIDQLTEFVPEEIVSRPGAIIATVILKVIDSGGSVDGQTLGEALSILQPAQADTLGAGLRALNLDRVRPDQFQMLTTLATTLADSYTAFALPSQVQVMRDLAGRFEMGLMVHNNDFEGVYEIDIEGRPGIFTFARTDPLGVVISVGYQHLTASMAWATYDRSTGLFRASSVRDIQTPTDLSTGQPEIPLQYSHFRIEVPSGAGPYYATAGTPVVHGFLRIGQNEQQFNGRRVALLRDFLRIHGRESMEIADIEGNYEGKFLDYPAILKIARNGPNHVASLVIRPDSHRHLVNLDVVYLDPESGMLYLTSRQRSVFFQVRGQIERGRITAQFVIGGRRSAASADFVKISGDIPEPE
jgi:hypothetical protein